jgi:hypothetical protein
MVEMLALQVTGISNKQTKKTFLFFVSSTSKAFKFSSFC